MSKLRIFVVDDDAAVRAAIKRIDAAAQLAAAPSALSPPSRCWLAVG